jgi:hypothetical protein
MGKEHMMYRSLVLLSVAVASASPLSAYAYGGPGSIISAVGAFFGLVAIVLVSLLAFLWYPLKRFIRWLMQKREEDQDVTDTDT